MRKRSESYKYKIAQYKTDVPKPKKNEIVIIPRDNRIMETAPYLNTSSLPSWWSKLPKNSRSIRRCQGTYDYVSYGITVPAWTNFDFRVSADQFGYEHRRKPFANGDDIFDIDIFNHDSAEGCPLGDIKSVKTGQYLKIVSPWTYFTEPGTSLMILPALHSFDLNYIVMPGIVHTDFYHQVNVVITILTDKPFAIKAGDPLVHLVPIKRDSNFKEIIWGNESMYRFIAGNGLGVGCLSEEDNSQLYRKTQLEKDNEASFKKNNLFKKVFSK